MKAVFERGLCFGGKGGECHAAVILAFANANLMDVQVRLFARFWTMVVISDVRPWNLLEQKFVEKNNVVVQKLKNVNTEDCVSHTKY